MTLHCEIDAPDDGVVAVVETSLRDVCGLRDGAVPVAVGSLPNDGTVIHDQRDAG